jgi:hypothetical protein
MIVLETAIIQYLNLQVPVGIDAALPKVHMRACRLQRAGAAEGDKGLEVHLLQQVLPDRRADKGDSYVLIISR